MECPGQGVVLRHTPVGTQFSDMPLLERSFSTYPGCSHNYDTRSKKNIVSMKASCSLIIIERPRRYIRGRKHMAREPGVAHLMIACGSQIKLEFETLKAQYFTCMAELGRRMK